MHWECTLAPPDEYNGAICVASVMQSVAIITVETCLFWGKSHFSAFYSLKGDLVTFLRFFR